MMGYPDYVAEWLGQDIRAICEFFDEKNAESRPHVARDQIVLERVMKIGEEFGETVAAMIAVTGQNPRKGQSGTTADVQRELLDVALTALVAWQSFGNAEHGVSVGYALASHAETVRERLVATK